MLLLKLQLFFLSVRKIVDYYCKIQWGKMVAVEENVCTQGQFQSFVQFQLPWSQALCVQRFCWVCCLSEKYMNI